MSGPRILKNFDQLVALNKGLRERIAMAESQGAILLIDGVAMFEVLEAIRKGSEEFEYDSKSCAARVAMVRAGKDTTIYGPNVIWRMMAN